MVILPGSTCATAWASSKSSPGEALVSMCEDGHHAALDEAGYVGLRADAGMDAAQGSLLVGGAVEVAAGEALADP